MQNWNVSSPIRTATGRVLNLHRAVGHLPTLPEAFALWQGDEVAVDGNPSHAVELTLGK
jgi:hypothetical protein